MKDTEKLNSSVSFKRGDVAGGNYQEDDYLGRTKVYKGGVDQGYLTPNKSINTSVEDLLTIQRDYPDVIDAPEYWNGTGYGGAKWKKTGNTGVAGTTDFANGKLIDANGDERDIVLVENYIDPRWFGAKGDEVNDDTTPIQNAMDFTDGADVVIPSGTFIITTTLTPKKGLREYTIRGSGKTKLKGLGLTNLAVIEPDITGSIYIRINIENMLIENLDGYGIKCISLLSWYDSKLSNIIFNTKLECLLIENHFSMVFSDLRGSSTEGHVFEVEGGNTTYFYGCYAKKVGSGKSGYRIYGNAVLVSCNGIDSGDKWGTFGGTDRLGVTRLYNITMINCNVEECADVALNFEYNGRCIIYNTSFLAPPTGTIQSYIHCNYCDLLFDVKGLVMVSKGATVSYKATASGTFNLVSDGSIDQFRRTDLDLTYSAAQIKAGISGYATGAVLINNIKSGRESGFILPYPTIITDGASTFSADSLQLFKTNNTTPTSLQTLTGAEDGQIITLLIKDSNTTIVHNYASSGRFILKSGANETPSNGDVYQFVSNGYNLVQIN